MIQIKFANNIQTRQLILRLLSKTADEDGLILDKNGSPVLDMNGQQMSINEFGGIKNGSEIFFKEDIVSCTDFYQKYMAK